MVCVNNPYRYAMALASWKMIQDCVAIQMKGTERLDEGIERLDEREWKTERHQDRQTDR